jgi:hypothetical protein
MDNEPKPFAQFGEALVAEAKRIEEDASYSSKGHFETARIWDQWHFWIGIPTSVAAAVAGVLALSAYTVASAVLSLIVAAASAVFTFLNPKERAAAHLKAGNAYKGLHNDTRIFREVDCQQGRTPEFLSSRLALLNERRNTLNTESPQIPRRGFEAARRGIEAGEATYAVDATKKRKR